MGDWYDTPKSNKYKKYWIIATIMIVCSIVGLILFLTFGLKKEVKKEVKEVNKK